MDFFLYNAQSWCVVLNHFQLTLGMDKKFSTLLCLHVVKVEWMWVHDPESSPKSSWIFLTNTMDISSRTKVAQKKQIDHINSQEK